MSTIDIDTLRQAARLAGFELSPEELRALRPAVERAAQALERLEKVPLGAIEPVTQFRMV